MDPHPSAAPSSGTVYRRLLGYATRQWPLLVLAFIGMGVEAAAAGGFTWLMKPMVDETFVARNQSVSVWLPLAIVGLFVVRGIATFATDYGMARVGRSVVRTLRALRSSSGAPSSRSRSLTRRLITDLVVPSLRPASVKLAISTTATKAVMSESWIILSSFAGQPANTVRSAACSV